jgi:CubicO group peptidase (beta-lactamase class C family)
MNSSNTRFTGSERTKCAAGTISQRRARRVSAPLASEIRARFLEPLTLNSAYLAPFDSPTGELPHAFTDVDGKGGLDDMSGLPTTGMYSLFAPAACNRA